MRCCLETEAFIGHHIAVNTEEPGQQRKNVFCTLEAWEEVECGLTITNEMERRAHMRVYAYALNDSRSALLLERAHLNLVILHDSDFGIQCTKPRRWLDKGIAIFIFSLCVWNLVLNWWRH